MEKTTVLILVLLVAFGMGVAQNDNSKDIEITTDWHDNMIPFYTPEIRAGEQKTLWFRAHNRLEKPRTFRAEIKTRKHVNVAPEEKKNGNSPGQIRKRATETAGLRQAARGTGEIQLESDNNYLF